MTIFYKTLGVTRMGNGKARYYAILKSTEHAIKIVNVTEELFRTTRPDTTLKTIDRIVGAIRLNRSNG